jgi:hypothetical protein
MIFGVNLSTFDVSLSFRAQQLRLIKWAYYKIVGVVIVQLYWLLKCGWLCLLNIAGRKRYALIKYKWKKRIHTRLKSCGSVITGVIIHRRVRLKKFQMFCSYHVGWRLGGGSWLLTVYLRKRGESKDMICTCKVKIAWYVKEKKRNYIQKLRSCENVITGAINQRWVRLKALQRFCSNYAFHHGYHRAWLRGGGSWLLFT